MEIVQKIDNQRGDLNRAEFIDLMINNLLSEQEKSVNTEFVTRTEMLAFEIDMKQLLKSFLDFFMAYDVELGEKGQVMDLEKFETKIEGLKENLRNKGGKATINWKP